MSKHLTPFRSLAVLILAATLAVAAAAAPFALGDKETIVFTGDSITQGGNYINYVEGYLLTRFPESSWRVIYSGKGSETLSGLCEKDHPNNRRPCLFERFGPAVAEFAPTVVVACYGINDGIYHPFSPERFEKYQSGVRRLMEQVASQTPARLLLLTPPVFDSKNPGQPDLRPEESYGHKQPFADYDEVMAKYAEWLTTLRAPNVTVGDLHTRMRRYLDASRQAEPAFRMSKDAIHPGPAGHLVMALAVLAAWNAPALVDEARIDAAEGKARAGRVRDLKRTGEGVEFTWTSKLPMPADAQWDARSLALLEFTETFNQHRLTVTGLPRGRWALEADGAEAGRFTAAELAAGIDLTALERFPTTARSRQIPTLLRDRRKLGYEPFRKGAAPAPDPRREEMEQKIKAACAPVTMKLALRPAGE